MRSASRTDTQSGFTLIELLVVLAILSLVTSVALVTLRSASHSLAQTTRFDAEIEQIQAIDTLLRQALSDTDPDKTAPNSEGRVRFLGQSSTTVAFSTVVSDDAQ